MNDNEPTQVFSITTSWPAARRIADFPPNPPVFPGGNAGRRARKQHARTVRDCTRKIDVMVKCLTTIFWGF